MGHPNISCDNQISVSVELSMRYCVVTWTNRLSGAPFTGCTCRTQTVIEHQLRVRCPTTWPQVSVLGPLLFALFMSPISTVISSFGVSQTQYADDTQLYIGLNDAMSVPTLSDCFTAVQHWLDLNGLSMNPDKTEAIVNHRHRRATTSGRFGRHTRS